MVLFGRKKQGNIIDLRVAPPAPAKLEFGMPTPCPDCGNPGYLDSIDLTRGVMFQHCPSCFTKWETTEAELAETT